MKLIFLGTRGYIEPSSRRHRQHTALLIGYRGRRVMIDCGESWRASLAGVRPHAIVLTHAHPDHAFGLDAGAPCDVWATHETWERIEPFPIARRQRHVLRPRGPRDIEGIRFEAFPVMHSSRAPAVGYRLGAGRVTVFYAPDVVAIPERQEALRDVRAYIGDGATVSRTLVRRDRASGKLLGHTTIRAQLGWCADEGVPLMFVTHCGEQLVSDEPRAAEEVLALARQRGVAVVVAHDGMTRVLR